MEFLECKIGDLVVCVNPKGALIYHQTYTITGLDTSSITPGLIEVSFDDKKCQGYFYPSRFEAVNPITNILVEKDPDAPVIVGAEHPDKIDWFAINKEFAAR